MRPHAAGLVLFVDDNNYIKLVVEGMGGSERICIVFAIEVQQSPRVIVKLPLLDSSRCLTSAAGEVLVALKLIVEPSTLEVTAEMKPITDTNWTVIGSVDGTLLLEGGGVAGGILVNGGEAESGRKSTFTDFFAN